MGYQQSELWKLFETRTKSDTQFKDAVKKLCDTGEALSATISRFFRLLHGMTISILRVYASG